MTFNVKLLSYVFLDISISTGPAEIETFRKTYDKSLNWLILVSLHRITGLGVKYRYGPMPSHGIETAVPRRPEFVSNGKAVCIQLTRLDGLQWTPPSYFCHQRRGGGSYIQAVGIKLIHLHNALSIPV
jgi:hypothetical protein